MVFIVLLGLWALVLAPTAVRWIRERSSRSSWESLGESVASSAGEYRSHLAVVDPEAGRYFGDAPVGEHLAVDVAREARNAVRQRRRTVVLSMAGIFVGGSLISFIPALSFLRTLAFIDLLGLLAYVGFAFYATNAEAFAELLGRDESEEPYGYAEELEHERASYGYSGYDEAEGYDEAWYEPRRAIGQ